MNLSVGIVGLPNVGKSTLFNALLKKQTAFVANYPFATIEPNVGVVPVPDIRLERLAQITKDEEQMDGFPPIKPAVVNFVDIAGLVKGASEGAGLGNKFLSHIREVSIIAHVVRAFEDPNIIREGSVGPKTDYEAVETELILADLQSIQKAQSKVIICAKIESDLSELSEEEQKQYLADSGVKQSGLERLIQKAYETLGLISFLTCGEKEVRAWTINKGMKAV